MRRDDRKICTALCVFLLRDVIKPFNDVLQTEFLFLGIILLALYFPFFFSIVVSGVFGYLKDCLSFAGGSLNAIEFPLIVVFVYYVLSNFNKTMARAILPFCCFAVHIVLSGAHIEAAFPLFSVSFFIHSTLLFFLLKFLLKQWIVPLSAEYI